MPLNPGPLHDRHACYHLAHSGGLVLHCNGSRLCGHSLWKRHRTALYFWAMLIITVIFPSYNFRTYLPRHCACSQLPAQLSCRPSQLLHEPAHCSVYLLPITSMVNSKSKVSRIWYKKFIKVCSNANPLHYYVFWLPPKADRLHWVWSIFESRTAWADYIMCGTSICHTVLEKVRLGWLYV